MVTHYSIRFLPSDRQVITVQTPWKKVPSVLRVIRDIHANISEAKISRDVSTFYLDRPAAELSDQLQVFTKLESFYNPALLADEQGGMDRRRMLCLSSGTYYLIQNRKGAPYTTIELMTENREGLLHDILQLVLAQPIHVDTIAANAAVMWDGHVYVILQLDWRGDGLGENDIVHIDTAISQAISIAQPAI